MKQNLGVLVDILFYVNSKYLTRTINSLRLQLLPDNGEIFIVHGGPTSAMAHFKSKELC